MDDSSFPRSRRAVLGCCAASAVGLAGCLGLGDDSPDDTPDDDLPGLFDLAGDGTEPFVDWLAPESTYGGDEGDEILFIYQNYARGADMGIEPLQRSRERVAETFGDDPGAFAGELLVGLPGDTGRGGLHVGEFDSDAIRSTVEAELDEPSGEYGGYTVYADEIAVGDDAVILTPEYERFVDARHGDGPHLRDEDDDVDLLLELQPAGFQLSATRREDGELALSGSSFVDADDDGTPQRVLRTFVFESAEDASVERAEEIAADGSHEATLSSEHHGRVVMLEYER